MRIGPALAIPIAFLLIASRSWAEVPPAADEFSNAIVSGEQLLTPKLLLQRFGSDQKRIWSFPLTAVRGEGWKPAVAVIGITAGLIALDPVDARLFQRVSYQRNSAVQGINRVLSSNTAGLLITAVPVTFYIAGLVHKDSYASNTALLAGEAVVNAEVVTIVMKDLDRRLRPIDIGPNGDFSSTWFKSKNRSVGGFGGFPSGHTVAAFSVATVFAERYHSHRWAPWVAYGLAGAIGLSRLNAQAHFPSDIVVGAVLGYSISHFAVLLR